ncbi:D-glycero-beta-D-manno-heptose 1-phosphate adenylyltransferase [bacterium]|nr:D-glycero-beta-D-manno-heptose 1-phosphate adenylyltransferase [bacterium]MBU1613827.1 D-glycero-beta-D-manno-heptose 1-phosphate adenylyltransferase [bacterium]
MSSQKIKKISELRQIVAKLKEEGKKTVFTNGCFDILHLGHIRYLEEAKELGDCLVVAVNSDSSVRAIKGDKRPLVSEQERAEVLAALSCVDYVNIFSELDPGRIISRLVPDVLVKGGDWKKNAIIGREIVEKAGGKVVRVKEVKGKATSNLIELILKRYA